MIVAQSDRWNPGRFVQTLDFFDSIPIVSTLKQMVSGSDAPTPPPLQSGILFDFSKPDANAVAIWGPLDDVVMGGVSDSGFRLEADYAVFTGTVSTANSGGFASVRTRNFKPPLNLATYQGIELQVQGDGQRYKFFLRDQDGWDALAYGYSFDTTRDEWVTVQIPFDQLTPVFRAKTQPEASPFNPSSIRSIQLMLSKFEYDKALNPHFEPGPFYLRIRQISAFR
ncbi:complex I intermediate-associated protein 30 (CIA30) [filamentous cyanobacterium CCP5]|nr:complex I intermediate-associated protein 30 (CIA30) [filamentous cyanobacterium CCP5]